MMKQFFAILLGLTFLASAGFAQTAATYRMKLNQPYKYLFESKDERLQEMMGETMSVTTEATFAFFITPDQAPVDGEQHLNLRIESALIIAETPQGSQTFGNDLTGKEIGLTIKPNGRVTLLDSTVKQLEPQSRGIAAQMTTVFPVLEAEKLTAGNSWEEKNDDTVGTGDNAMIRKRTTKYTVAGKETRKNRECLKIDYTEEVEFDGKMPRGGMDLHISGTNNENGSIFYDSAEGIIVEVSATTKGDQNISDPGGSSMKVNMSSTGTQKLEFIPQ
jgi:hypothetical protein